MENTTIVMASVRPYILAPTAGISQGTSVPTHGLKRRPRFAAFGADPGPRTS